MDSASSIGNFVLNKFSDRPIRVRLELILSLWQWAGRDLPLAGGGSETQSHKGSSRGWF